MYFDNEFVILDSNYGKIIFCNVPLFLGCEMCSRSSQCTFLRFFPCKFFFPLLYLLKLFLLQIYHGYTESILVLSNKNWQVSHSEFQIQRGLNFIKFIHSVWNLSHTMPSNKRSSSCLEGRKSSISRWQFNRSWNRSKKDHPALFWSVSDCSCRKLCKHVQAWVKYALLECLILSFFSFIIQFV